MAPETVSPMRDSNGNSNRPIPLVALRRPTLDASSSSSLDSSSPTASPSTPASLTPPPSATNTSPASSPERLSRQTTCVSGESLSPSNTVSSPPPASSSDSSAVPPPSPAEPASTSPPQRQLTWASLMPPWNHRRAWLQNSIGIAALAVALVGMFVYALRGYKMAKWTEYNDLLQSCAALIQAKQDGGPLCDKTLAAGPRERPYDKRYLYGKRSLPYYLSIPKIRSPNESPGKPIGGHIGKDFDIAPGYSPSGYYSDHAPESLSQNSVLGVLGALSISVVILIYMRQTSRTETVFESSARSEGSVKVTHDHPDGPIVDEHRGSIHVTQPSTGLGSFIRQRVKQKAHDKKSDVKSKISWKSGSGNSSAATLIGEEAGVGNDLDEHRSGLVELKQTNGVRHFEDSNTGEILHLSPWKSTQDSRDEEEDDSFEKIDKGTIARKITEMSIGSAILGGGKAAETSLHEKAQAETKQQSQQMGDSLAGMVSNEPASIKEAFR